MGKSKTFRELVSDLSTQERIKRAKEVVEELTRRIELPLSLHEANRIVGYSDQLAAQIPESYAGHAFRDFVHAMFRYEVVQLFSLWEAPEPCLSRVVFSLRTVADLIDNEDVIGILRLEEHKRHSTSKGQLDIAIKRANDSVLDLRKAIKEIRDTVDAPYFEGLKNFRDKVSHSLSNTRLEQRKAKVVPMKYGFERELLETTAQLIESLYCWVNGAGFDISKDRRDFAKTCAEELWCNCHFDIPDHFGD